MELFEIGYWVILAIAGAGCGFLNTLASSGSVVSLPILLFLGFPEDSANATNRLPVLVGSVMATLTFAQKGQVSWSAAAKLTPPAAIGALAGVLLAEHLPDRDTGLLITGAVLIAVLLLFTKIKQALDHEPDKPAKVTPLAIALMLAIGFWLGLIVIDGATYLLLVLILICSFALPRANALKVLLIAVTTLIAIVVFWSGGEVKLAEGAVLSLGSIAGGYYGAKLSGHMQAREWAFRIYVAVVLLELAQLAWHYGRPLEAYI
jgi:uncharacterized membrane protein YfcA